MARTTRPWRAQTRRGAYGACALALATCLSAAARPAAAAIFVVFSNADSGPGSLRKAIDDANTSPGPDEIDFFLGANKTIKPLTALSPITGTLDINGTSQVGYAGVPLVVIDGSDCATASGLTVNANGSTIRGLVGFAQNGIVVSASGVTIKGNYVGTTADGTAAKPNGFAGVQLYAPGQDTIGGITPADRNVISGNGGQGVAIVDGSANAVIDNYIGANAAGTAAVGNGSYGIWALSPTTGNFIGVAGGGGGNLISANGRGVGVDGTDNFVIGNVIGLNAAGNAKLPNQGGIDREGSGNTVGGTSADARNVVSGNDYAGIAIGGNATGCKVIGNRIGTNPDGTVPFGNQYAGIFVYGEGNTIGGAAPGEGNLISGGKSVGMDITDSASGNTVLGNTTGGGSTTVEGELASNPNGRFRIEVFSSPDCDESGFGEGKTLIGTTDVATDAGGHAVFELVLPGAISDGFVTATATSASGDTSEFSPCADVGGSNPGTLQFSQIQFLAYEDDPDGAAEVTIVRTGGLAGSVSVHYATQSGGATPGVDYTDTAGTLTFATGEVAKVIEVPIALDLDQEPQEKILLTLSAPTGGATLGALASSKIILFSYDPAYPAVSVSDASLVEGNGEPKAMQFKLTLSPTNVPVTVAFQTNDGTAFAGQDYEAVKSQVVFRPGDGPKTVSVPLIGDDIAEGTETFYLAITGVYSGIVFDSVGDGVIFDDDAAPAAALCVGGTQIVKPHLTVSGLGDAPGNERIVFNGRLKFAPGVPAGTTPLDLLTRGAQILIEDLGAGSSALLDLTDATTPVPSGGLGSFCQVGKNDGWKVNPGQTTYGYRNASGALLPACAPGSARGLNLLRVLDRRASTNKVVVKLRAKTTLAQPVGPLRATIVLGADAAWGAAGVCGTHAFEALDCAMSAEGTRMICG